MSKQDPWETALADVARRVHSSWKAHSELWTVHIVRFAERRIEANDATAKHNDERRIWIAEQTVDPASLVNWLRRQPRDGETFEPLDGAERELIALALKAAGERPGGWPRIVPFPTALSNDNAPTLKEELHEGLSSTNPDPPPEVIAYRLASIHDGRFPAASIFRNTANVARVQGQEVIARELELSAEIAALELRKVASAGWPNDLPKLPPGGRVRCEYEGRCLTPETMRDDLMMILDRIAPLSNGLADTTDGIAEASAIDVTSQYVTLDQAASIVNRSKKTLERKLDKMPPPDVEGGGGKPHEWRWDRLRPWLQSEFDRELPLQYPSRLR